MWSLFIAYIAFHVLIIAAINGNPFWAIVASIVLLRILFYNIKEK